MSESLPLSRRVGSAAVAGGSTGIDVTVGSPAGGLAVNAASQVATISAATSGAAGSMSAADKAAHDANTTKLAGIAAGATNTPLSTATPLIASGSGSGGSGTSASKDGHVHPEQTTITGNAATATNLTAGTKTIDAVTLTGASTMGGVALLSQTNTVTGITGKAVTNLSVGHTSAAGYGIDFGSGGATNTLIALYNNGGAPAGIGIGSAKVILHLNGAGSIWEFRATAAGASIGSITGAAVCDMASYTAAGVAVPTISSSSTLTNKIITAPSIGGTVAGSGTYSSITLSGTCTASSLNLAGSWTWNTLPTFSAGYVNSGSVRAGQRATTATTVTMGAADDTIFVDSTAGAVTLNLVAVSTGGSGRRLTVKNFAGANNCTLTRAGADTIDGATTLVVAPGGHATIMAQGTASTLWNQIE